MKFLSRPPRRAGCSEPGRQLTRDLLAVLPPVYLRRWRALRGAVEARYSAPLHVQGLRLHQDRRRTCGHKDGGGFPRLDAARIVTRRAFMRTAT